MYGTRGRKSFTVLPPPDPHYVEQNLAKEHRRVTHPREMTGVVAYNMLG